MNNLKISLNFGTIAGIAVFAVFLINYLLGFNPLGNASWLGAWIPFLFIYLTIKNVREKSYDGYITYGQAFKAALLMILVYASLGNMLNFLFVSFAAPQIFDEFMMQAMEEMEKVESFLSPEMYDQMMEEFEKTTPSSFLFSNVFNQILGGTILALIFAGFMKKNRSIFETPTDEQN
jgi:uncharacterized membrane protein YwzB